MVIRLQGFGGEIPRMEDFYLPDTAATDALNAKLSRGSLAPYRQASTSDHEFVDIQQTIYLHGAEWLAWNHDADVVPGPVAQDRLYITHSNGMPTMWREGVERPLKVPAPTITPNVALVGTLEPDLAEDVAYAFTWVTSLGEESQPSPLSALLQWSPGRNVQITGLPTSPPLANRLITNKRIYRAVTSTSGATDLFYVGQTTAAASSFLHNPTTQPDQEAILTKEFDAPPDNLRGLTAMPNGMMAAFAGKELYFCEPYIPHAWPSAYVLTTNDIIIGLAAFGTTLAVLTTGTPYIVQGMHPDQMAMTKMEQPFPCLSKRSIVDLGYAAVYASTDGLVQVSEGGAQLLSANLWTRHQWQQMQPTTIDAGRFGQNYAFTFNTTIPEDRHIVIIEGGDGGPSVTRCAYQPEAIYTHIESGDTYYLASNRRTVRRLDHASQPKMTFRWRSKPYRFSTPQSFGAVKVEAVTETGDTFACRIFADGVLIRTVNTANVIHRLPAGAWRDWQIELVGTCRVFRAVLGRTPAEMNDGP